MSKAAPKTLLRALPSVDSLLRTATARSLRGVLGATRLSSFARQITNELRSEILAAEDGAGPHLERTGLLAEAEKRLAAMHQDEGKKALRRVINATGVVLHTNLGRAPLSAAARRAITEETAGYCNLEYDIELGERGRRGPRSEELLVALTGAEAALVVNNCAAAALLVLTTLASDGDTLVSRGELVEIGGDFRVPDVMAQSGTRMIEVGTTNRTRLSDYENAMGETTRLLMRVHASNYRIIGFTKAPTTQELADLAHRQELALYEDAGSGALIDLSSFGIDGEPVIRNSIEAGADVVSFSGDKLLGGPQAGLLVGRSKIIERMRSHPLYRALRADKIRLAALEATLEAYARETSAQEVPAHRFITMSAIEIKERAEKMLARLQGKISQAFALRLQTGESAAGGGAGPTSRLPTVLISLTHQNLTASQIELALRLSTPPVIARIIDDSVLLDLRTVAEQDEVELERALLALAN